MPIGDIQEGNFAYSQQGKAAELFLPRHPNLEALATISRAGQDLLVPMRKYASQLIDGWVQYLKESEGIFIQTYVSSRNEEGSDPASNGKISKANVGFFGGRDKIVYNYVNHPSEPEAMELKHDHFNGMSVAERQQLLEQHPEIAMQFDAYDTITSQGIFPQGYLWIFNYRQVSETPKTAVEYTEDLGIDTLAKVVDKLFDDTEIHSLQDGERIGEICLRCERVDP